MQPEAYVLHRLPQNFPINNFKIKILTSFFAIPFIGFQNDLAEMPAFSTALSVIIDTIQVYKKYLFLKGRIIVIEMQLSFFEIRRCALK